MIQTFSKILLLLITFVTYSASSVFSKLASQQEPLSLNYVLFFMGVVFFLGIYAILWQQVLARMPLNKAFLCKSITIVMILAVSHFIFHEAITFTNILGISFILLGLVVLSWKE